MSLLTRSYPCRVSLLVRKFMGTKQTIAYVLLIVFFCTLAGLIYGSFVT